MPYPPLRAVEAYEIMHQGEPMILVRDPEQLSGGETLLVPLLLFLIMGVLDGRRDGAQIQEMLKQATGGHVVSIEDIDRIVADLDEHYLLANDRAARRRAELIEQFVACPTRAAIHAGQAYPEDPEACRQLFAGWHKPAKLEPVAAGAEATDMVRGLIVPHIDLRVGGECLMQTLAALDPGRPPRLYIILGVAHQPAPNLFTLTDKSFETPLGLVRTDREATALLRERYGPARLDGEYAHKHEHSVEFPAVALRYLHADDGERGRLTILPLLCGSLHDSMAPGGPPPRQRPEVGDFLDALRALIDHYGGDVCLVASVDLSHVGLKFGDDEGVSDERAERVRQADLAMLELAAARDPEGFFDHFRPDANARNVDAVTSVYVLLHALGQGAPGRLTGYHQWREAETDSMVTYAGMVFE